MPTVSIMRRAAHSLIALSLVLASTIAVQPAERTAAADPEHGFLTGEETGGGGIRTLAGEDPALPGFVDKVVFSGLTQPTAVAFSSDGRVFVAEKDGRLLVYSSLADTTASVVIDLRTEVSNHWDRGLTGLELSPNFPADPWIYLLYTYDAPPGGTAPVWNDTCPDPPRSQTDGCVVTGRLIRISVNGSNTVTARTNLIVNEWCQQFPSHSVDDIEFGPDGHLYVSAGDGANFNQPDWGQFGGSLPSTPTPANPCGDPPSPAGTALSEPDATGGLTPLAVGAPRNRRRAESRWRHPAHRSGHRAGRCGQPVRSQHRCQRASHSGIRLS